jgi:hypothetical protein
MKASNRCREANAGMPGVDVVGSHFIYLEMLLADGTDASLPLVGLTLLAVGETAKVQVRFVAVKDVVAVKEFFNCYLVEFDFHKNCH